MSLFYIFLYASYVQLSWAAVAINSYCSNDKSFCVKAWTSDREWCQFELTTNADYSYVALGIGEWMADADIMVVWRPLNATNTTVLSDRRSLDYVEPFADFSQDLVHDKTKEAWTLDPTTNLITFRFQRKLKTNDSADFPIVYSETIEQAQNNKSAVMNWMWALGSKSRIQSDLFNASFPTHVNQGTFQMAIVREDGKTASLPNASHRQQLLPWVLIIIGLLL